MQQDPDLDIGSRERTLKLMVNRAQQLDETAPVGSRIPRPHSLPSGPPSRSAEAAPWYGRRMTDRALAWIERRRPHWFHHDL